MKGTTRSRAAMVSSRLLAAAVLAGGVLAGAGPVVAATATSTPPTTAAAPTTDARRAPAAPCPNTQLIANSAERVGASAVRITVINDGPKPCVLRVFPTVALAGQGSPDKNKPLGVVREGQARPVTLPVGGRATTQITFTPVLGEADGYCKSGATPTVAPSIVLGVGGGGLQLSPADGGDFALCGTSVRATAFR
ncbi:DUF4232 domain-containing protein [Streptomyces sp. NPDC054904]|uniref:DUF4232 domain-containing protein n=1 Tax=unclassified Streptomyces TaxID=2593676 RepID=UPI002481E62A|nr:DUF4232 domain-containing protein [Streptomyces sp. Isolate_45]MDA5284857.1 DUF4232 domain-containing protein [Streptomyces sp. Isolate_45]